MRLQAVLMSSTQQKEKATINSRLHFFVITLSVFFGLPGMALAEENIAVSAAKAFVTPMAEGLADQVEINFSPPSSLVQTCHKPEPFLPPNQQIRPGRIVVGIKCPAGNNERLLYLQGYIKASGHYLVIKKTVAPGQVLSAAYLEEQYGDLGALPRNTLTSFEQAVGKKARIRLKPGSPLLEGHLSKVVAVNRGQIIELESGGRGFKVIRKGEALASGGKGDIIRVRLSRKQIVTARVIAPGRAKVPLRI